MEHLSQMKPSNGDESPSDATKRLSTAMAVIYIMNKYNVQFSEEDARTLCDALILRTPDADHICHDFMGIKRNFQNGMMNVIFLLSRLEPLFAVDQLLQRTLMAAMSVKNIEAMITSQKIAPEVCMANLTYFLKRNLNQNFDFGKVELIIYPNVRKECFLKHV
ncbi:hypothetical protein NP493_497g00024 [Ridgeia piscesae]|uniref:Uncharacterized protein n=1 Tax=Ridgeia piscesae TaxID=27915 RepID=A0AAD9KXR9_RIDPI|nr:hypothetical protein NP493_497g00024 [Ridgeia piscesae]